jgi:hypothetical protein
MILECSVVIGSVSIHSLCVGSRCYSALQEALHLSALQHVRIVFFVVDIGFVSCCGEICYQHISARFVSREKPNRFRSLQ